MYLSKQWRESRVISILALAGLALLLALVVWGGIATNTVDFGDAPNHRGSFGVALIPLFYVEAVLAAFWGWLAAGIGVGKNLGEDSGSFLFTRPRRRAWFLWTDWSYAMAQIAAILVLANLMIGLLVAHILHLMQLPATVQIIDGGGGPVSLFTFMVIISVGALLFAGLIYGLTYFCTIVLKRSIGVMLGAGILVAYLILGALVHHYYPAVHLPNLMLSLVHVESHRLIFASDLTLQMAVRAAVMMAFPVAAQFILDRSEI